MTDHTRNTRLQLVVGAGLAALALQACNKPAQTSNAAVTTPPQGALPLDASGLPPAPPAPAALPSAPAAPVALVQAPRQRYRYVDRAAAMNSAFADSPPDYTVDYQGSRPWIWRAGDGSRRVVEHTADGDRYYYYDPGADQPYLVRGPDYTYGYDQGHLAVVYDSHGRALDEAEASARADRAGEYLARARQLYYASEHDRHEAATAAAWRERRDAQFAQERQWEADQQSQADWHAWHDQNAYSPPVYAQEHDNRVAYAAAIGAAAVGAGALIAGRDNRQAHDGQHPNNGRQQDSGGPPGQQVGQYRDPRAARQVQDAARQQQIQASEARQAQQASQANAANIARQQQSQAEAARQAQAAQQQQRAAAGARQAQVQAEGARRSQAADIARAQGVAQAQAAAQARANADREQASQANAAREAQIAHAHEAAAAQQQAQARAQAQAHAQAQAAVASQAAQHTQQAQAAAARQAELARQSQARTQAEAADQAAAHQQQAQAASARAQADAARAGQAAARAKAAQARAAEAKAAHPAPAGPPAKPGPDMRDHGGRRQPGDHNPQP